MGGAQIVGERGCRKGQGVGTRRVGQGGAVRGYGKGSKGGGIYI